MKDRTQFKHLFRAMLLLGGLLLGTQAVKADTLMYYVDVASFFDREGNPYIETYLDIDVSTLELVAAEDGGYTGGVRYRLQIEKRLAEKGDFVYEKNVELLVPRLPDQEPATVNFGLMDIRRVTLPPGEYIMTGFLEDMELEEGMQKHRFVRELVIEPQPMLTALSDIELIQSFEPSAATLPHTKHGYSIIPLITNSSYLDMDSLKYYFEVYNVTKESEEVYFVNTFITLANSTEKLKRYQKVTRQSSKDLDIVSGGFDIQSLPSATYYLNVEVYSKTQDLIASGEKKFFVANSRISQNAIIAEAEFNANFNLTEEQLDYYLHTLQYISRPTEMSIINSLKDLSQKQSYFYSFWDKRREKPTDPPSKPWKVYKSRVDYANEHFKAAHLEGWRTDRGRVLLQYGAPNDIERNPSSNTNHPYDVWRYNKMNTQANVIFVFFNPNLATDDYELLHSNKLGEQNNPRWEFDVVRTVQNGNLDVDNVGGRWDR